MIQIVESIVEKPRCTIVMEEWIIAQNKIHGIMQILNFGVGQRVKTQEETADSRKQ